MNKKLLLPAFYLSCLIPFYSFSAEYSKVSIVMSSETQASAATAKKVMVHNDFYQGCLLFQDDIRSSDHTVFLKTLKPHSLIRSWYRFGEPVPEKAYSARSKIIKEMKQKGIRIGGGESLSVVNDRDLNRKDFDQSWLSTNLNGSAFEKDGKKYASLSVPGFRSYLVKNLMEQVQLGVKELHLGETNGKILYDDYSLGIKGDDGFVQWIQTQHPNQNVEWWTSHFGDLGSAIANHQTVTREMFQSLNGSALSNFQSEWGKPDSWNGTNTQDQPAFLAYAYQKNIQSLMTELKNQLKNKGKDNVFIDI